MTRRRAQARDQLESNVLYFTWLCNRAFFRTSTVVRSPLNVENLPVETLGSRAVVDSDSLSSATYVGFLSIPGYCPRWRLSRCSPAGTLRV
jgi:hypothetical protein